MDVTYAVVNKPRRGGGAGGRDSAHLGRDHAPSGRDTARPAQGPAYSLRDHAPSGQDPAYSLRDHAPAEPDHAPPGTASEPGDGAYEVVAPPGDPGSCPRLGFNFRIGKPKGPREPPAEWARV